MIRAVLKRLRRNEEGATIVEFALIMPALMVVLMGLFDLAYNMYTAQMLQGAIQQAARDSTIEGAAGQTAALDGIVTDAVQTIAPGATLSFSRKSYTSFSETARPEDYDDINGNGSCDNGEPYEDANGNGTWDTDPGKAGLGGGRDAVLYTVDVSYDRMFPIFAFIPGQTKQFNMSASTVLRNQPYGAQSVTAPTTGNCT